MRRTLKKKAMLGHILTPIGVHIGQNIYTAKRILTRNGGRQLASDMFKRKPTSIIGGLKNAIAPERGILKDHISEMTKEIGGLGYRDRVLLSRLSNGEFGRVLDSGALEKSPGLVALLKSKGFDIDKLLMAKRVLPKDKYNQLIAEHEALYNKSPIGQFAQGVGDSLRKIDLKKIRALKEGTARPEALSESAANVGLYSLLDPTVPAVNMAKRLGADHAVPGTVKKRFQDFMNNRFVKPEFERAAELAQQGRNYGKVEGIAKKYITNPLTFEAANYRNQAEVLTRKLFGG